MVFFKTPPDQYDSGAGAFEAQGGGGSRVGGWVQLQEWISNTELGKTIKNKLQIISND